MRGADAGGAHVQPFFGVSIHIGLLAGKPFQCINFKGLRNQLLRRFFAVEFKIFLNAFQAFIVAQNDGKAAIFLLQLRPFFQRLRAWNVMHRIGKCHAASLSG